MGPKVFAFVVSTERAWETVSPGPLPALEVEAARPAPGELGRAARMS